MKSRITLRIGKILEALTAPAEERGRAGQKEQHRCEREETGTWKWHQSEGRGARKHVSWVGVKGRDRGQRAVGE